MQIISPTKGETVVIDDEIFVTVVDILGDEVVLAIDAPDWVEVCKKEALEESESVSVRPR